MSTLQNYEAHPDFSALVSAKAKADRAPKARTAEIRKTGGVQYIDPEIAAMAAFTKAEEWRLACTIAGGVPGPGAGGGEPVPGTSRRAGGAWELTRGRFLRDVSYGRGWA